MKKIIFTVALLLSSFALSKVNAQVHFGINIGTQPVWGPVGYNYVEYYYMPDIDAYYYVPSHQYIYLQSGRWTFSTSLPARFNYNINTGYKVVINERQPYKNAGMYRTRYAGYRGNHSQAIIRNSNDSKYFENKNHPQHNKWEIGNNDHAQKQVNYQERENDHKEKGNEGGGNNQGREKKEQDQKDR
jgi:hypothetical protein